ncbi:MAG: hypothetical protein K2I16_10000 [Muribaculaceae bacterium]|nr:hypothetical protein [Muribaculaceae bacterium]MDE5713934.1 hypothetical protein [Muribaculaceae bacterium]
MDNYKFTSSVSDIISAFNARIAGDRSIDDYALFRDISSGINRPGGKPLFGRPLQWCAMMLDRWHKEFKTGRGDKELPVYDTLQRVSILMDSDLWAFETRNEARFKQLLFDNHRHLLNNYQLSIINYQLLSALHSFLIVSTPYLTPDEFLAYDAQIRCLSN